MKIQKDSLSTAIKRVQAAIPQKTQLEILKGCLCRDGWIIATDTMLTAKVRVDGATDECIIPQQAFSLIESLRRGEVEITKGNGDIRIKQEDIKCRYLSKDPADFPTQGTETETEISVDADDLIGSINRVSYAMKNGGENDKMSSICLKADGETLSIVALDGYMIAWDRHRCEGEFEMMIPARAARTISGIGFRDEIKLRIGKHKVTFASDDCEVTTAVLDGTFFQFEKMFKLKITTLVTADRKTFLNSVKRASLFEKTGDKKPLAVEVSGDKMTILLVTTDSSYHENLPVTSKGEGLQIGMNVSLLRKTLAAFYDDEIYIGMVNPRSPVVIKEKGSSFLACVLPVLLRTEQTGKKEGTCPLCRKEYYSAPAMSRKDDAPICQMCGHKEALEAAGIVEGSSVYKALMQELEKGFRLQEEQARFEAEKRKGVRDGRLCKP